MSVKTSDTTGGNSLLQNSALAALMGASPGPYTWMAYLKGASAFTAGRRLFWMGATSANDSPIDLFAVSGGGQSRTIGTSVNSGTVTEAWTHTDWSLLAARFELISFGQNDYRDLGANGAMETAETTAVTIAVASSITRMTMGGSAFIGTPGNFAENAFWAGATLVSGHVTNTVIESIFQDGFAASDPKDRPVLPWTRISSGVISATPFLDGTLSPLVGPAWTASGTVLAAPDENPNLYLGDSARRRQRLPSRQTRMPGRTAAVTA